MVCSVATTEMKVTDDTRLAKAGDWRATLKLLRSLSAENENPVWPLSDTEEVGTHTSVGYVP
jgi:hypothetical protein